MRNKYRFTGKFTFGFASLERWFDPKAGTGTHSVLNRACDSSWSRKSPSDILADFNALIQTVWAGAQMPREMYMPKSQAAAIGADVSNIPDGSIVVLREGGYVGVLEDDDE